MALSMSYISHSWDDQTVGKHATRIFNVLIVFVCNDYIFPDDSFSTLYFPFPAGSLRVGKKNNCKMLK